MKLLKAKEYQELKAKEAAFDEVAARVTALEARLGQWESWEYEYGPRIYTFTGKRTRSKGRAVNPGKMVSQLLPDLPPR